MARAEVNAAAARQADHEFLAGRNDPVGEARAGSDDEIRRLRLDNEDLLFECDRLKSSVARAQAEVLSLSQRNDALQRRIERIRRLMPGWSAPLARAILSRLGK